MGDPTRKSSVAGGHQLCEYTQAFLAEVIRKGSLEETGLEGWGGWRKFSIAVS